MACSKYTLTNTGSTIVNFNYRRCDDSLWEYQVELNPGQTKNIWLLNGTFTIAPVYTTMISLINQGAFPPISETATPTPTPSVTPSNTPTGTAAVTPTPTNTGTPTGTPTNTPTGTSESTPTPTPTNTETPTNTPTGTAAVTSTPTPTSTETPTPTNTSTVTPTNTQTPTPTDPQPARYEFSVNHSETSSQEACYTINTATIFGNAPTFQQTVDDYNFFWACPTGTCPEVDLSGWYVNDGDVYELDSEGNVLGIAPCGVTPTPTVTPVIVYMANLRTGGYYQDVCGSTYFGNPANVTIYSEKPFSQLEIGDHVYGNSLLTIPPINANFTISNGSTFIQIGGTLIINKGICG